MIIFLTIVNFVILILIAFFFFQHNRAILAFEELLGKFIETNQTYYDTQKNQLQRFDGVMNDLKAIKGMHTNIKKYVTKLEQITREI